MTSYPKKACSISKISASNLLKCCLRVETFFLNYLSKDEATAGANLATTSYYYISTSSQFE